MQPEPPITNILNYIILEVSWMSTNILNYIILEVSRMSTPRNKKWIDGDKGRRELKQ